MFHISVDNSLSIWFRKNDKVWNEYRQFRSTFEDDESLIIIYKNDSLFTQNQVDLNRKLTDEVGKLKHVETVISITNFTIPYMNGSTIRYRNLIPNSVTDPQSLKQKVISKKILVGNLVSKDGNATGIVITLDNSSNDVRSRCIKEIETLLHTDTYKANRYYLAGGIAFSTELYRLSTEESGRMVLISFLIMFVLVSFLFRSILLSVIIHINSLLAIVWTMALFTLTGNSINMISGLIPLVLLVVSYTVSIHLVSHYRKEFTNGDKKIEAMQKAFKSVFIPCLFSIVTTAIAFLSFTLTDILPIFSFGLFIFIGLFITLLLSILFLPVVLFYIGFDAFREKKRIEMSNRLFIRISELTEKRNIAIALICLSIFIVSIVGITRLSFQTDQMKYLSTKNPVRQTNELARQWFNSVYFIEIVFNIPDSLKGRAYTNYKFFSGIEKRLLKIPEVQTIHSPTVYIDDFFLSEHLKKIALLSLQSNKIEASENSNFSFFRYISDDGGLIRMTIKTHWMDNENTIDLIRKITPILEEELTPIGGTYNFTGIVPLYIHVNQMLTRSQLINISVSFLLILLVFVFLYRNIRLTIVAMLPNIFPVVLTLGIMGWFGVSMDVATVLIAAISLGISVDDTIHLIHAFKNYPDKNLPFRMKYYNILSRVGGPITFTSLILITGLLVLMISSYLPVAYLGLFLSLNILFAYLADVLLLPSLFQIFRIKNI
jgi:predicted RND superfamily exporter protein